MDIVREFVDQLNEVVYVVDVETYDIVYVNQKLVDLFGYQSKDEIIGQKCYQALQKNTMPCSFCNNKDLRENCLCKRKCFNQKLSTYLYLVDTMVQKNGRKYRVELAMDITDQEEENGAVKRYCDVENEIRNAVHTALQKDTPDEAISCLLEHLGRMTQGERAYIFEIMENGDLSNTYEWVSYGISSYKEKLQTCTLEEWQVWQRAFKTQGNVMLKDIREIKETNLPLFQILYTYNISSIAVIPMYNLGGSLIGFMGVDNPDEGVVDSAIGLLHLMGHYICGAIRNRDLIRKLTKMSYEDQQTGMGNRHAFWDYIETLKTQTGKEIGIIFIDITGLKKINDTKGHQAGDRMILQASNLVRRNFPDQKIFRHGGDEFLVFCSDIGAEVLKQEINILKEDAAKENVILAVGYGFCQLPENNALEEIEKLISVAETKMYQDKAEYYQRAGLDRYRR